MTGTPQDPLAPYPHDPVTAGAGYEPGVPATGSEETTSTTDTARDEAGSVKDTATGAARSVTETARQEAGQVTSEVRQQARQLADETRGQLQEQAHAQRDRAVGGLRTVSAELDQMTSKSDEQGLGAQLAREGAQLTERIADFLDGREPGQLVDDVRSFARQRPGTFLVGAALAGVVAGRLSRGAISERRSDSESAATGATPPPAYASAAALAPATPPIGSGTAPVDPTLPSDPAAGDEPPLYHDPAGGSVPGRTPSVMGGVPTGDAEPRGSTPGTTSGQDYRP